MGNIVTNDFTSIRRLPLRSIALYYEAQFMVFTNLEQESSFEIRPVTRQDHFGRLRQVGFRISVVGYVPQNNAEELRGRLETLRKNPVGCDIQVAFGTTQIGGDSNATYHPINSDGGLFLDFGNEERFFSTFVWEYEQVQFRPRLVIRCGIVVPELSDDTLNDAPAVSGLAWASGVISWDANPWAVSFRVEYADAGLGNWTLLENTTDNDSVFAPGGGPYDIRVRATSESGKIGAWSVISITV